MVHLSSQIDQSLYGKKVRNVLGTIQNCCQHIHQHVATHHQQPNDLATQQMNSLGIELQVLGESETKTASTERPSKEDDTYRVRSARAGDRRLAKRPETSLHAWRSC